VRSKSKNGGSESPTKMRDNKNINISNMASNNSPIQKHHIKASSVVRRTFPAPPTIMTEVT
jgi:hypothetical protein